MNDGNCIANKGFTSNRRLSILSAETPEKGAYRPESGNEAGNFWAKKCGDWISVSTVARQSPVPFNC
jgi:hypothetical protein